MWETEYYTNTLKDAQSKRGYCLLTQLYQMLEIVNWNSETMFYTAPAFGIWQDQTEACKPE